MKNKLDWNELSGLLSSSLWMEYKNKDIKATKTKKTNFSYTYKILCTTVMAELKINYHTLM